MALDATDPAYRAALVGGAEALVASTVELVMHQGRVLRVLSWKAIAETAAGRIGPPPRILPSTFFR